MSDTLTTPSTGTITVLLFASLADKAGCSELILEFKTSQTFEQLFNELSEKYQFTVDNERLRVACNHRFTEWQNIIEIGDTVAFIPAVSGG